MSKASLICINQKKIKIHSFVVAIANLYNAIPLAVWEESITQQQSSSPKEQEKTKIKKMKNKRQEQQKKKIKKYKLDQNLKLQETLISLKVNSFSL